MNKQVKLRLSVLPLFLICCALLSLYFALPSVAATPWVTGEIDAAASAVNSATALDSNGKVHVAYYDEMRQALMHATNDSGAWLVETVDASGAGRAPSIAVDANNKVHISYDDTVNNTVKYSTNASGSWFAKTVAFNAGKSSIALDSNGTVYISFAATYYLALASSGTGTIPWVTTTIDVINSDGLGKPRSSIKVDSANKVHISYLNYINSTLKYATNSSGSWAIQTVDNVNHALDQATSLAVGTDNKAHISYALYSLATGTLTQVLNYATNSFGDWITVEIDQQPFFWESSVAVDSFYKAHVAYRSLDYLTSVKSLKYATNISGTFVDETVDAHSFDYADSTTRGMNVGLALDSINNAHIAYTFDYAYTTTASTGKLKYATNMADAVLPTGSIVINSGLASTGTPSVLLTLSCNDGAGTGCVEMSLSNDGVNWSSREAYAPAKAWMLSSDAGEKTVSVMFKDVAGNWSIVYSDTINLECAISASTGTGGSISPSGSVLVNPGAYQTFTITPDAGFSIYNVLVDGVSVGAASTYTFTNVTANHTIRADFSNVISASTTDTDGYISPLGNVVSPTGIDRTFTITPKPGYSIADVLVDGVSVGAVSSYTFTNVTANHTIRASFVWTNTYVISASTAAGGSISPSGNVSVNSGASQTFMITPDAGYIIAHVYVDGVSVGAPSSYTFTNVTKNHYIRADFLTTYVISASTGTAGSIYPPGNFSVNPGASQTYTITPNAGYGIADVLVDGVSVGAVSTYIFTNVTASHTIRASFVWTNTYVITATAGTGPVGGSISPSGKISLNSGASQTFTITPDEGYIINKVLVDGVSVGVASSYTFTNVTANHTIIPVFSPLTYVISASTGTGGSILPSGDVVVNRGTFTTFTIKPNAGYSIANVLVDGVSVGALSSYTFANVTANHTISATFLWTNTYVISASAAGGGSISPSGNVSVNGGASQAFSITPNTGYGYSIADVLVDGVSVGLVSSYTFTNVTANHTISATFKPNSYVITSASTGTGGSISPSGNVSVNGSASQAFTITPNAGYSIANVLVDGVSVGLVSSYTFTNVTANHTISASFAINTYTITASAGAGGTISPSGNVSVNSGASQAFTITPNTGYSIANVLVDGVSKGLVSSYTFTNVTANHTISASFSQNPTITVITPNGGENWKRGTTHDISWSYTGNPGDSVKIELLKGGVPNTKPVISSTSIGSGSFSWTIPKGQAVGSDYTIRITSTTNSSYTDTSNGNFTISK